MQSRKLPATEVNDWIWSNWLKFQKPPRLEYHRFTHLEFIEDETKRPEVEGDLAKLIYEYHASSPVDSNLLAQLKYPLLASVFMSTHDQRPHDPKTRYGNFIEILACELAKKQGYNIPVLRLNYNPNPDQSMKGDDILGFRFTEGGKGKDTVLVGEGKFRSTFEGKAVKEAYEDLTKKSSSNPISMEFFATILSLRGNEEMAANIRQLRQKIASRNEQVEQKYLLFLGTVGQPTNPFECLEEFEGELLSDLVAVNIVLKDGFQGWISKMYEKAG